MLLSWTLTVCSSCDHWHPVERAIRVVFDAVGFIHAERLTITGSTFLVAIAVDRLDLLDASVSVGRDGRGVVGVHDVRPRHHLAAVLIEERTEVEPTQQRRATDALDRISGVLRGHALVDRPGQRFLDLEASRLVDLRHPGSAA